MSLVGTGIVAWNGRTALHSECVQTLPKDGTDEERIELIAQAVMDVIDDFGPHIVAVESPAFSRSTGATRIGELQGVIKHHLHKRRQLFVMVPPTVVKQFASGLGNATKDQMIQEAAPWIATDNDNIADALHLARYGYDYYNQRAEEGG